MGARLSAIFPFLIAVLFPPAGLLVGLTQLQQDRELGIRLIVVSTLAAAVWVLLVLS